MKRSVGEIVLNVRRRLLSRPVVPAITFQQQPPLPPPQPPRQQHHFFSTSVADPKKLTVVLDMDECLIHSTFPSYGDGSKVARPAGTPSTSASTSGDDQKETVETFELTMLDGQQCLVHKRPRLDWFLEAVANRFNTYVMTAGMQIYAEPLLDRLDPTHSIFKGRFYRDSCVPFEGHFLKDISIVGDARIASGAIEEKRKGSEVADKELEDVIAGAVANADLSRIVLVDNNPASFTLQPSNGVPIPSFYDDPMDRSLEDTFKVLCSLDDVPDVRVPLDARFDLKKKLAPLTGAFVRLSRLHGGFPNSPLIRSSL